MALTSRHRRTRRRAHEACHCIVTTGEPPRRFVHAWIAEGYDMGSQADYAEPRGHVPDVPDGHVLEVTTGFLARY
jgi:hypothetical protein